MIDYASDAALLFSISIVLSILQQNLFMYLNKPISEIEIIQHI